MTRQEIQTLYGPTRTRYAVTHVDEDGDRIMSHANQGQNHFDTPEAAQAWIDGAKHNNSWDTLRSVYNDPETLEVRAVECYAHGDAVNRQLFDVVTGEPCE